MRVLTPWDRRRLVVLMLALAGIPEMAAGQAPADPRPAEMVPGISAGSRREDYLRSLQTAGIARPYPWSLRGFSPRELDLLRPQTDSHPRALAREFRADSAGLGYGFRLLPVTGDGWLNTTFAYGMNDGAIWRGRGVTAAVTGGVQGRWGPLSLTVAPIAFYSQNHPFDLMPNGYPGLLQFGDGQLVYGVDLPQRFGNGAFAVLDPGQSSLRLDTRFVTAGVSSANQGWGPMSEFPFILGDNAAGFPHVFFGTGSPANLLIGTFHARIIYGRLRQSDYSAVTGTETRRFASGIIGAFSPRGLPTLEIGAARFFQHPWPDSGLTSWEFRRPFETLLKSNLPTEQQAGDDPVTHVENQLASLFFRWVFPTHGLEIYGEFGREDHSWDRRDLVLELEHTATYGFGLRRVWRADDRLRVFRAETMNYQTRAGGLHRYEGGIYTHTPMFQGHTHAGQLLGAGLGAGSAGGTIAAFEQHGARATTVVSWSRIVRMERRRTPLQPPWEVRSDEDETDVQHALEVEHRMDRGGRQIRFGVGGVYELNRNLAGDAFNFMLSAGVDLFPR